MESDLDNHINGDVDIFFDNGKSTKQYISNRLWGCFRGITVAPNVFTSIHMALEKFLP